MAAIAAYAHARGVRAKETVTVVTSASATKVVVLEPSLKRDARNIYRTLVTIF